MRVLIKTILFSFGCLLLTASVDAQSKAAREAMGNARILETVVFGTKDSVALTKLFSKNLAYIHSNGRTENYEEAIRGIVNNKSVYEKDATPKPFDVKEQGDSVIVTKVFTAMEHKADGTSSPLNLKIETVWAKEGKNWKLFRRQAYKVE